MCSCLNIETQTLKTLCVWFSISDETARLFLLLDLDISLTFLCVFVTNQLFFWDVNIRCLFSSVRCSPARREQKCLSFSGSVLWWCRVTIRALSGISAACGSEGSAAPPTAAAAAPLTAASPPLPPPATTVPASCPCRSSPRCCPPRSPGQPARPTASWPASD